MNKSIQIEVDRLIDSILRIDRNKIITIVSTYEKEPFVIDISSEGQIGYEEGHELLFRYKLIEAFNSKGGLLIRQFLPIKVQREMQDGKKMWIPKKNIYGILISNGSWKHMSKFEVKELYRIDSKTGKYLPLERDIIFSDFPI